MKYYIRLLFSLVGICSCNNHKTVTVKQNIIDSCRLKNNFIDCLDITTNPDTASLFQKIDSSQKKVLLIFTGRAISGTGILDKKYLANGDIFEELKKYSIYIFYVDERRKDKDSLVPGPRNMNFQRIRFNSVTQPHYIIYTSGVKQCEEHYMYKEDEIIEFLRCQTTPKK